MAISELNITDAQAKFALARAVQEKKVSMLDVRRYIAEIQQEIKGLEDRIARLRGVHGAGTAPRAPQAWSAASSPAEKAPRARRARAKSKKPVDPAVQKSRELQGRYISAIRQVPLNKRAKFAALAKAQGREAAIAAIKKG
jgi:hypothetical protein